MSANDIQSDNRKFRSRLLGGRTVLHSMETVVGRWSGNLGKYQSRKRYLLQYAKVPYVT